MGYYRSRPAVTINCAHCGLSFLSAHKRTRYCGNSCRTLAWLARQVPDQPSVVDPPAEPSINKLAFSWHNVATIGAGVLAADATKAAANALFDVQPTNAQVVNKLERVERMLASLHYKHDVTEQKLTATRALVVDVIHGVAAGNLSSQQAIMSAQQRRGLGPPPTSQNGR